MMAQPLPNLETAYAVVRDTYALRITPHAHMGPGRMARFSLALGLIFATACLGGAIYFGVLFQAKFAEGGFGPPPWLGWVFPAGWFLWPLAGLTLAGCLKLYVTLRRPLLVEDNRLLYGTRELVPADDAAAVHVERVSRWVSGDDGPSHEVFTAYLYVATKEAKYVELPKPYFSNLDSWELGEALGRELARALRVPCLLEAPPGTHSTPTRHARRRLRVFGVFAFIIGVPHFLGGFVVVFAHVAAWLRLLPPLPRDMVPWWFGLIFVGSGTLLCWLGCRWWDRRRATWKLLTMLALLVAVGVLVAA